MLQYLFEGYCKILRASVVHYISDDIEKEVYIAYLVVILVQFAFGVFLCAIYKIHYFVVYDKKLV